MIPARKNLPPRESPRQCPLHPFPMNRKRKAFPSFPALVGASVAWFTGVALAVAPAASRPRPNIVFILTDDLGYGDLGVFFQNSGAGGREPRVAMKATPQLDRLAAGGMQLRGHYTAAPVCAPARASFLTGVHQGHADVRDNQFDKALEDHHTVAGVLKQAGYRTACIGKWGLQGGKQMPAHPLKRGFDEYFGYIGHGAGHAHYPKEDRKALHDGMEEVGGDYDKCYTTDLFTARAKKFIIDHRRERKEQPFFLYLAYDTPHAKTQLPSCAYPEGSGTGGGLQWLGRPGEMINTARGTPDTWYHPEHAEATWRDPGRPGNAAPWPDVAKRYATMVRRIDDAVGDLAATLKDLGIERDTLLVFTSDNGPSKESYLKGRDGNGYKREFDPGFFRGYGPFDGIKRDCYEGGVRVGAIVHWPGSVPPGRTSGRPGQFHDWLPTFCEMAGLPAPARTDGVSLLPELLGKGERRDSTVYVEYFNGSKTPAQPDFLASRRGAPRRQMQMIRSGNWVGVRHDIRSHDDDFEIYDVVDDPGQRKNLAAGMKDLQQRMKDRVLQIRRPDPAAPRPYADDLPVPPAAPPTRTKPGLEARVFPAAPWPVDDLSLPPATAHHLTRVGLPPGVVAGQAVVLRGWLKVEKDGDHLLRLPPSSRAVLKLHGATVIDHDRGSVSADGRIKLKAGFHPLMISVLSAGGPLELKWSIDGAAEAEVPAECFFTGS